MNLTSNSNHGESITIAEKVPCNNDFIHCMCGKKCKGVRGLKRHQRSCLTIKSFSADIINDLQANYNSDSNNGHFEVNESQLDELNEDSPQLKSGVKLPNSQEDWKLANDFFHAHLPIENITNENMNEIVNNFNNTVYSYFKENYGLKSDIADLDKELKEKYKSHSKTQLKSALKRLKTDKCNQPETRFVSKLLRAKLSVKNHQKEVESTDHDREITKHFWSYCKKFIGRKLRVLPSFNKEVCQKYFRKAFRCVIKNRHFQIPDWIPKFGAPKVSFNTTPPSYKDICKIIKRMKASGSPCPLDQISVIPPKRCPFLRSYVTKICAVVWEKGQIPEAWRKAISILIYKKGETDDPGNFRPITLEPVLLKVFTSFLRNRMFEFMVKNNYAESCIQKGFIPGISGTFEHIASMSHIINQAKLKQRSVTITLIDLRNAFGEVDHNLIKHVMKYHHIPDDVCEHVVRLYSRFYTAVTTERYTTDFIRIEKGVLQGDCLSPLIFNILMNTFIQYIKGEEFSQFGYRWQKYILPKHWLQFADDAAAVTGLESENQILLNAFNRWCTWSGMPIRVDKCHSFGIRKVGASAQQVKPKLFLCNQLIRPQEINEPFEYLGRSFDFKMSNEEHKKRLKKNICEYMEIISALPLHPKNKLLIYQHYVLSKVSWDLTVANISMTWVKENLENKVSAYVRLWLELPISGTLDIISLTKSKYGLGYVPISSRFTQCQVTFRKALSKSTNKDIQHLFESTSTGPNLQYDQYLSTKDAIMKIRSMKEKRVENELKTQSLVISSIWKYVLPKSTPLWSKMLEKLPRNIYNFTIRYLSNTLPNGTNAKK